MDQRSFGYFQYDLFRFFVFDLELILVLRVEETLEVDDSVNNNHFENIQSTNWQTMRFKPPHPRGDTGWRVEFRSMESQLTDFENAAFTVFVALLGRAILFFKLNLYLPLSLVDENMRRAHVRSALTEEKFFFRKHIRQCDKLNEAERDSFEEMTVLEILCGKGCYFPGLIPVMESYLDVIKCDHETRRLVDRYFQLIKLRAEGKLMTNAMWMRRYVSKHPSYKKDSALNQEIVHDLFNEFIGISGKKIHSSLLFGDLYPMSE